MDAGVREELVKVAEPSDVPDLGDERRPDRRADAWDRPEATGDLAVKQRRHVPVGGLDLTLELVILVEQEADLEGDLGIELGNRDQVGCGGREPRCFPCFLTEPSRSGARRRVAGAGRLQCSRGNEVLTTAAQAPRPGPDHTRSRNLAQMGIS